MYLRSLPAVSMTLLLLPLLSPGQEPAGAALKPVTQSGNLKVVVLQGEGAKNNIRVRRETSPAVEVRDEADKAVEGAEVIFQLPTVGPGGTFHSWMRNQTTRTNAQGQAVAIGFAPNDELGRFNIKVTATSGSKSGSAVIAQSNVAGGSGSAEAPRRGWWKAVAVVGAGVLIGGVVAATRDGNGSTTAAATTPISITSGPITIAGPR